MTDRFTSTNTTTSWAFDIAVLTLLTALLGYLSFQSSPIFDELYHVLAARSWAQDGSVAIANGSYTRAILFTEMLGALFRLFGDGSLETAKILPIIAALLLTAALYWWVRATFGRLAAWIATLLFILSPGALYVSQFVRFYSWHALAVWVFTIAFYGMLTGERSLGKRVLLGAVGLAAWAIALHFQPTTLIATAGFGLWVALMWGPGLIARIAAWPRGGWILLGLAALSAVLLFGLFHFGFIAKGWGLLRHASPWQDDVRDDIVYYHGYLLRNYPVLWALLPLAALITMRRNLGVGLLFVSMFLTVVLLHSLAAAKNYRYLHYAMPFLFVLWGVALAEIVPAVYRMAAAVAARFSERIPSKRDLRGFLTFCLVSFIVVFLFVMNSAYPRSVAFLVGADSRIHWSVSGWQSAAERLRPLIDESDIFATSNGLFALYYMGRYDIDISASQVAESVTGKEFGRDPRTGAYAISTPQSLAELMACFDSGIYISDASWRWRDPDVGVSDEMADFLETHTQEIDLPKAWKLRAFRWQRPADAATPETCPSLPGIGPQAAPATAG